MCSTPRTRLKAVPRNENLGLLSELSPEKIVQFNACADAAVERQQQRQEQHQIQLEFKPLTNHWTDWFGKLKNI